MLIVFPKELTIYIESSGEAKWRENQWPEIEDLLEGC